MTRPLVLGLTGSIGMGKTATAALFAAEGIPVWDADAAVHRLYSPGQAAAVAIAARYPQAIGDDGHVDRARLRGMISADLSVMDWLNATVHPLTAADRARFMRDHGDDEIVLLDIPLLFETGADTLCDAVITVTAPPEVQRARVLARGMTEPEFRMILARQMADAEKRARADHIIETITEDQTRAAVRALLQNLRASHA